MRNAINNERFLSEIEISESIDFLELLIGNDIDSILSIIESDKLVSNIIIEFE